MLENMSPFVERSLKFPTYLLGNCYGTYFGAICEYEGGLRSAEDCLLFLKSYRLVGSESTPGPNPWSFQQVSVLSPASQKLFTREDFVDFLMYLERYLGLVTSFRRATETKLVYEDVREEVEKGNYVLCAVDEYELPTSKAYYHQHSNHHGLLVLKCREDGVSVLDSETGGTYEVAPSDLVKSFYRAGVGYYTVDASNFGSRVDRLDCLAKYLSSTQDAKFVEHLVNGIAHFDQRYPTFSSEYLFRALMLNIRFKIAPVIACRRILLEMAGVAELSRLSVDLLAGWQKLGLSMLRNIERHEYDLSSVVQRLSRLAELGTEVSTMTSILRGRMHTQHP